MFLDLLEELSERQKQRILDGIDAWLVSPEPGSSIERGHLRFNEIHLDAERLDVVYAEIRKVLTS